MLRRLLNWPPSETLEGYEHPELIEIVFQKTKAYQPQEAWIETAKTVLDFGGGCGLHYKSAPSDVRWAVVETPAMVERASELATERLQFFASIERAKAWLGSVDLMHSNGALQYTSDPLATLRELCSIGAGVMQWHRTFLSQGDIQTEVQISRLADNGPGRIRGVVNKSVRYRSTRIPERTFLACHVGYRLANRAGDSFRFHQLP